MYCSNLISAKIFTVHTKVKILPHLSPFSMFSWGTKLPAVSLLSVKYVFIIEASTASWLLIAILILQFWNDLDCWMAAVACWCSEEHLNINKVLLSLDLSFFSNTCTVELSEQNPYCFSVWKYTRPYIRSGKTVFNLKPLTPCWKARVGHLLHCMWMGKYWVILSLEIKWISPRFPRLNNGKVLLGQIFSYENLKWIRVISKIMHPFL